jgi:rhodanese-related sulfurtransferase
LGYLEGSFAAWKIAGKEVDALASVPAAVLEQKMKDKTSVFDVRKPGEYASEHIRSAENTPLDFLNKHITEFPKKGDFFVHCAGGYRSVIAASILKSRGYHNVIDVAGGYDAIRDTTIERIASVCPSTLK